MRRALSLCIGVAAVVTPLRAQSSKASRNFVAIDSAFSRVRSAGRTPAAAIIVVSKGKVIYRNAAGYADLDHEVRASAATRFDWASIAKQFTAYAVSLLVERGVIQLDDDVRRWIPELDLDGARITVRQLIHHTSGLEDGDGVLALAGWGSGDVVRHSDLSRLLAMQKHLRFAPGAQTAYSNGGYTLLVEIVQRATQQQFSTFADSAIFRTLGMGASQMLDGPDQLIPDQALPYWPTNGEMKRSSIDMYPGAGGLVSSVDDMARWMTHFMSPKQNQSATLRLREQGTLTSGAMLDYAWGIARVMDRGFQTYVHSGSGPASAAQVVMIPELQLGVAAATAGHSPINPAVLARMAIDAAALDKMGPRPTFIGPRMMMITEDMTSEAPAESRNIHATAEEMDRMAGLYRLPDSTLFGIRKRADRLEFGYAGREPWMPLHALGGGRFVRVPWWEVLSIDAISGSLQIERTDRSLLRSGDSIRFAPRVIPKRFDVASSARFQGQYYSDELGATYEVRLRGNQLVLQHPRHGIMQMTAVDDTAFIVHAPGIVRAQFVGTGNGQMLGLELTARSWSVTSGFRRVGP